MAQSGKTPEGCKIPTADDCENFARRLLQVQDIEPVGSQGATSYTLICLSQAKIIQFRLKPLDEGVLALAHEIYGDLVPSMMSFGSYALPVYVCLAIPGQIHIFKNSPRMNFLCRGSSRPLPNLRNSWQNPLFGPSRYQPTPQHPGQKLPEAL